MRLLTTDKHEAFTFTPDLIDEIPPYAILSHTWGTDEDEVTFAEVDSVDPQLTAKHGYQKLLFCMKQAKKDGLQHIWIDTCCIDKRNLTELSEAINSMFRWYQNAAKCYVYLSDVQSTTSSMEEQFRSSRWFTRGWTLQELLAPRYVEFFSKKGEPIGGRYERARQISEITDIEIEALQGRPLTSFDMQRRFEWAAHRQTKKPEDAIYCLLGIFGVSMPLNYAEGKEKAMRRLKQEIADEYGQGRSTPRMQRLNRLSKKDAVKRRKEVIEMLSYDTMESRRSTISHALADTCKWILEHEMLRKWRSSAIGDGEDHFLWIKGHPGAGKSTLMKFIDYSIGKEVEGTDDLLLSFYFNARGDILDKTVVGMYRSLIVQLIKANSSLEPILDEICFGRKEPPGPSFFRNLPVPSLKELLSAIIYGLENLRIYCLVDALDETNEDEVLDMVYFLQDLSMNISHKGVTLITCFASRHYPTLDLPTKLQLVIDHEKGHISDVEQYIHKHLYSKDSSDIEPMRVELLQKSNGIFIWIVLVVGILNKEFRRGNIAAAQTRLNQLPSAMSDLLKEIFAQGDVDANEFLNCMRWILYAKRPLQLREFHFAMLATLPEVVSVRWDSKVHDMDTMERAMLTRSKGLAELTSSKPPVVQFIHESIRDYLIYSGGLAEMCVNKEDATDAAAHELLKQSCLRGLVCDDLSLSKLDVVGAWKLTLEEKATRRAAVSHYPFLGYAAEHVLYHAEEAADTIDQTKFCENFDKLAWCDICIAVGTHAWRSDTSKHFDERAERPNPSTVARVFLHTLVTHQYYYLTASLLDLQTGLLNLADTHGMTAIAFAIRHQIPLMVDLLLHAGAEINIDVVNGSPALHHCQRQDPGMVKKLISAGANINAADVTGRTALHLFASYYKPDNLKVLLEAHPNLNAVDREGWSALHQAVDFCHVNNVELLLEAKIDMNIGLSYGLIPLHMAVVSSRLDLVQLLIKAGAEINVSDALGNTALHLAANILHARIIQDLREHGIDTQLRNNNSMTALEVVEQRLAAISTSNDYRAIASCFECMRLLDESPPSQELDVASDRNRTHDDEETTDTSSQLYEKILAELNERALEIEEQTVIKKQAARDSVDFAAEIKKSRQDPDFHLRPVIEMSQERSMTLSEEAPTGPGATTETLLPIVDSPQCEEPAELP